MESLVKAVMTIEAVPSVSKISQHLQKPLNDKYSGDEVLAKAKEIQKLMSVPADQADASMKAINEILGGYGIETLRSDKENVWDSYYGDAVADVVNFGDPYDATVLYDIRAEKFILTAWGDWIEFKKY